MIFVRLPYTVAYQRRGGGRAAPGSTSVRAAFLLNNLFFFSLGESELPMDQGIWDCRVKYVRRAGKHQYI